MVVFYDIPKIQESLIDITLNAQSDAMIVSMMQKNNGKLIAKNSINLDNYPGKEFIIEEDKKIVSVRSYLINTRIFQMITDTTKEQSSITMANDFVNSFKLLK